MTLQALALSMPGVHAQCMPFLVSTVDPSPTTGTSPTLVLGANFVALLGGGWQFEGCRTDELRGA